MTQALPFGQLFEIIRQAQPARRIDKIASLLRLVAAYPCLSVKSNCIVFIQSHSNQLFNRRDFGSIPWGLKSCHFFPKRAWSPYRPVAREVMLVLSAA